MTDVIYDDPEIQAQWEAYWAGYKQGKNVESYSPLDKRAARSQFERHSEAIDHEQ